MANLKLARGNVANLITGGSSALASGARVLSAAYDNATALEPFGQMVLTGTFSVAPTAGQRVNVYAVPALDGANYVDGDATIAPAANLLVGWGIVRGVATLQRIQIVSAAPDRRIHLAASLQKFVIENSTGQQLNAGWTLDLYPAHWASS